MSSLHDGANKCFQVHGWMELSGSTDHVTLGKHFSREEVLRTGEGTE